MDLAILTPDYQRYIATFMHPFELELETFTNSQRLNAIATCVLLKWHAGVEFIITQEGFRLHDMPCLTEAMPELLLKYRLSWLSRMAYNDPYLNRFIYKITETGYELKYKDWQSKCSSSNFRICIIQGASRVGNLTLMRRFGDSDIGKLLDTDAAVENNQFKAVIQMLNWGAYLYDAWRSALVKLHHGAISFPSSAGKSS